MKTKVKRIPIYVRDYPELESILIKLILDPVTHRQLSKSKFHKAVSEYMGYSAFTRYATGNDAIYLLPEDAVAFKLKFKKR